MLTLIELTPNQVGVLVIVGTGIILSQVMAWPTSVKGAFSGRLVNQRLIGLALFATMAGMVIGAVHLGMPRQLLGFVAFLGLALFAIVKEFARPCERLRFCFAALLRK